MALRSCSRSPPNSGLAATLGSTWPRHPAAAVSSAAQPRGLLASRPRARRSSTQAGAQAPPAAAGASPPSVPPAAASAASAPDPSPARSAMRWQATCTSRRRNSAQSLAERGAHRRPRVSSVRAARTWPSFSSRSAASNQKWTSRGCSFTARSNTRASFLVLPLRRQKSMYWYHRRLSALNLRTQRSKRAHKRCSPVASLRDLFFQCNALLRRRLRHSNATSYRM
mmetsp:Transcript_108498/g.302570  ORF Transcript_108498/g.302570 Transcript_108498/m.302570 type:complete len:225 (+) Transcript_108498:884-1558(+)